MGPCVNRNIGPLQFQERQFQSQNHEPPALRQPGCQFIIPRWGPYVARVRQLNSLAREGPVFAPQVISGILARQMANNLGKTLGVAQNERARVRQVFVFTKVQILYIL